MKLEEGMFNFRQARSAPIDGLRGIACLQVVSGHFFLQVYAPQIQRFSPLLASWGEKFDWGVNLFFVISGFLIGGVLLDHSPTPAFKRAFYIRRMVRIWPLYYFLVVVVMGAQYYGADSSNRATLAPLWTYLCFIQNFWTMAGSRWHARHVVVSGPTWSLAIEEFFYLLAPLFLVGASAKKIRWLTVLTIGACATYRSLLTLGVLRDPNGGILCHIDTIAIGVFGASLLREPRIKASLSQHWMRQSSVPILALLVATASIPRALTSTRLLGALMPDVIAFLFLGLVLLLVLDSDSGLARLLSKRVLTGPGRYCYFIYLFHFVILENSALMFEGSRFFNTIAVRIAALVMLFVAAPVVWRLIEQPLIQWARIRWPYVPSLSTTSNKKPSVALHHARSFSVPQSEAV